MRPVKKAFALTDMIIAMSIVVALTTMLVVVAQQQRKALLVFGAQRAAMRQLEMTLTRWQSATLTGEYQIAGDLSVQVLDTPSPREDHVWVKLTRHAGRRDVTLVGVVSRQRMNDLLDQRE